VATETFLARQADIDFLTARFQEAEEGKLSSVLLHSPIGGGKRALLGQFVKNLTAIDSEVLHWRPVLVDEEDGLRTLLRMYAALFAPLHANPALRGKVEMLINAQLPSHPKRVQGWLKAFVEGMRSGAPKDGSDKFQVRMPKDNPLIGLVEVLAAISTKMPVIANIQNIHSSNSIGIHGMLEAMFDRCADNKMFILLTSEAMDETSKSWFPPPLLHLIQRRESSINIHELKPWGSEEVSAYLTSKDVVSDAENITRITKGRPAYVAELIDHLIDSDSLSIDLSDQSLATLMPKQVDESELEDGDDAANGRKHAGASNIDSVALSAAFLGTAFPSRLVADIGGWEQESIDDLLDATGGLFAEDQFSKPFQTWVYRFTKTTWRQAVLDQWFENKDTSNEATEHGRKAATFMERFLVPQGSQFIPKTARLWAEMGQPNRANALTQMALGSDKPEVWAMTHDLMRYFESTDFSERMQRSVLMSLLDKMVQGGSVEQADKLYNEANEWAAEKEDRHMQGWILFAGSRLDLRRQDHFRARDRAKDALTIYKALEQNQRVAELLNHQAMIEFTDGKTNEALELVNQAMEAGQIETPDGKKVTPRVAASGEFLRGMVARRTRKFEDAIKHFRTANEIAGNTGQPGLALDSGLNYGECLLLSGKTKEAIEALKRVATIAEALKNGPRLRTACSLLTQAHGAVKDHKTALDWAKKTLALTQQLKFNQFMAIDLYNLGFFTMVDGDLEGALNLMRESKKSANLQRDVNFAKELLFNLGIAAAQLGAKNKDRELLTEAKEAFSQCLPAAKHAKDAGKVVACSDNLAGLILTLDKDKEAAIQMIKDAISVAEQANLKDQKKSLSKKLESLQAQ